MQLPAGHRAIDAANAHKQHLAGRLRELCAATGTREADSLSQDLLLIYEGMNNLIALGLGPDPVTHARHLAEHRLDDPT